MNFTSSDIFLPDVTFTYLTHLKAGKVYLN